ncbi:MAG: hypothetical protein IKD11_02685 [Oscillospiraceae bacterium]|nr:hypothetical protein [Oscillospiraceae bacterium]
MASVHLKLRCGAKCGDLFAVGERLTEELIGRGAEKICENEHFLGGGTAYFLAFERFYMRNGSYASLSVMLTDNGEMQTADIVGSGGGEGIFNIGLGANTNFAGMAADVLQKCGFAFEEE